MLLAPYLYGEKPLASLLSGINTPADLKQLSIQELAELAREIRARIIDVTSRNGGHLASSLGTVELTLAVHYVFDTPEDKIIWDVGHQAYAHKLVTGRKDSFDTIRKAGGLSGFTRIGESPFDTFSTGHSSTSISAGLGIAQAKKLSCDERKTVAIIGDGSMTAGLSYEGLNQAGDTKANLLVILNDNDMSIGPNVGALSAFLSRTLSANYLQGLRSDFGKLLKSLPKVGDDIYNLFKRSEESFKAFVTPGMLFEAFNFSYFGPINGHRLDHLIKILKNIKALNEPVLLHVRTKKGKGYPFAEKNPGHFHGVGSFDVKTGKSVLPPSPVPTYTKVFGEALCKMAARNSSLVAITAAMPDGTGLAPFAEKFPERFFDVGIAEQHAVTFAAGLSTEGYRPVVAIYSTFLQRAYDQILHDVCLDSHPVLFAIDRAGFVGDDGPTHHGLFDLAFLRPIPNMVIMAPRDEASLVAMVKTGMQHKGPCAIRYPRGKAQGVPIDWDAPSVPMGKAEILREGEDITLLGLGHPVYEALKAAELLSSEGISAKVIDARFLKPLDEALLLEIGKKGGPVLTLEEGVLVGGFGSAVLEFFSDHGFSSAVRRLGVEDAFISHGNVDDLRKSCGLDVESIVFAAKKMIDPLRVEKS